MPALDVDHHRVSVEANFALLGIVVLFIFGRGRRFLLFMSWKRAIYYRPIDFYGHWHGWSVNLFEQIIQMLIDVVIKDLLLLPLFFLIFYLMKMFLGRSGFIVAT